MRKIGRAHPVRMAAVPELQVLRPVVITDAVLVVHLLMRLEGTAEALFHDKPMLENIPSAAVSVALLWRDPHENVAVGVELPAAGPLGMLWTECFERLACVAHGALPRTKAASARCASGLGQKFDAASFARLMRHAGAKLSPVFSPDVPPLSA
jgi:hypothetical protein